MKRYLRLDQDKLISLALGALLVISFVAKHGFGKGLLASAGFAHAMAAMWLVSAALTALSARSWRFSLFDWAVTAFASIYVLGSFLFAWPAAGTLALIGAATGGVVWTAMWLFRGRG